MTKPTGKPRGRPRKDSSRNDGPYENAFLSVGNRRDRSNFTQVGSSRILTYAELDTLYTNDGFARRIIDTYAEEMVRAGFEVENIGDDDLLEANLEGLKIETKLAEALRWSGLFGGALIVLLVNDGNLIDEPLNEDTIREVEDIRVYDRWETSRYTKYLDPADKRFGQTETYQISPAFGFPYVAHASRCIVVDGASVTSRVREQNDGWGDSKLQCAYEQLIRMNMSHVWANALLERSQQAVHGIPNLTNVLRAPGGENLIRQRIDLVDMARGVNNTVVIDAEESYDLKSTPLTGVDALVDRLGLALSAVTGMPETLLFGRAPGGLSNSNQNDLENWYAKIAQQQQTVLKPVVDRIVGLVLKSLNQYTDDYKIEFNPLWMPSDKETAETNNLIAKTDEIYANLGALDPSELRKMMGDRGYEIDEMDLMPEMPEVPDTAMAEAMGEMTPQINEDSIDQIKDAEAALILAKADSERAEQARKDELHKIQLNLIDEVLGGENA